MSLTTESMYGAGSSAATVRMLREIERIQRVQKQMEAIERFQREIEAIERLCGQAQIVRHHDRGTPANKAKRSSAKKSAKPAGSGSSGGGGGGDGGDGGDGGGDGDGPQRTRSVPKKSRSSKSVITRPSRLPSTSPGKTASTPSPKVSPNGPQPSREVAIFAMSLLFAIVLTEPNWLVVSLIVIGLIIIALAAMGHSDVAKVVWRSVPKLLEYLTKSTDEESKDPDEES